MGVNDLTCLNSVHFHLQRTTSDTATTLGGDSWCFEAPAVAFDNFVHFSHTLNACAKSPGMYHGRGCTKLKP